MGKPEITICIGSSCFSRGNSANVEAVEKYLSENGFKDDVDVSLKGCLCTGKCPDGPIVIINGKTFTHVVDGVMADLLKQYLPPKKGDVR